VLSAKDFESLLPWYLNSTLSDSERDLVAAYLQAHPEEQARVQWNASLREGIKQQADELPEDLGLKRALSAVGRGAFTQLLQRMQAGDDTARNALFVLAYQELRKLALVRLMQSGRRGLLDATALVHETYIRLLQSSEVALEDRRSFFAFASQVMRNVIVDAAHERLAERRGGGGAEELRLALLPTQLLDDLSSGEEGILDVHEALAVLEQADARLAQVVEMRYFGGYTEAEIAETLGITERAVERDWNKARLLLKAALQRKS
jgi:RNA polymerase sigma factor (TIGR02999 family)